MSVRLYAPNAQKGKEITLNKEQIRHLKVLRLKEGEKIQVFDGQGHEFEGVYSGKVRLGKLQLEKEVVPKKEPQVRITLAVGVPKGPRMDVLVEKVSELGVVCIVPIICSRSVVKPGEAKVNRWRRIAIEACAQSGRSIVPTISDPIAFGKLLSTIKQYNHAFICHPSGQPLGKAYCECATVLAIVGPEGDFTEAELEAAQEAGIVKVSLGTTTLRTETAGMTVVAQIVALSEKIYK